MNSPLGTITARQIQASLVKSLRLCSRAMVMPNTYILDSPWEADVIAVTRAYYWHEYEIKVTLADYRKDFEKTESYKNSGRLKHDLYAAEGEIRTRYGVIPKPKEFSFVVPQGMLDGIEVPKHCGIIECTPGRIATYRTRTVRSAPTLRKASKLNQSQIYNLACKAAGRLCLQLPQDEVKPCPR